MAMGLVAEAFRPIFGKQIADDTGFIPANWQQLQALGLPNETEYRNLIGDGSGASIVGAVVNWMQRTFPEAPLQVLRPSTDGENDTESLPDHPMLERIEQPNDYYDDGVLWMGTLLSWVVDGNGYWIKIRSAAEKVVQLWYAPHFCIEPKAPTLGEGYLDHYEYRPGRGQRYELRPQDVMHFRFGLDPANPLKGRSPLKEQLRELYSDEEAARFSAALLRNLGVPGLVITPGQGANLKSKEDRDTLKQAMTDRFGGSNRGKPLVLSAPVIVSQFGFSPEQMSLRDLRSIPEERVTAALGIPAAVVGLGVGLAQTKVGATMKELRELATEQTLVPTWRIFAKQLKKGLLPDFETDKRVGVAFDTSNVRVLQEDMDKLHERVRGDVQAGIVSVARAQGRLGYHVDESQNVYLRALNLLERPEGSSETGPGTSGRGTWGAKDATQAQLRLMVRLERGYVPLMERMAEALAPAFEELGQMAADAYEALKGRRDSQSKVTLEDEQVAHLILASLRLTEFRDKRLGPIWAQHYRLAADLALDSLSEFGVTLAVGARDRIAEMVVADGGTRLGLVDLAEDTRRALFQTLTEAREANLGAPATARRIREMVPGGRFVHAGPRYRAQMIARTEIRHAAQRGVLHTCDAAGFQRYLVFDARLGPTDPECESVAGTEVDRAEAERLLDEEHPNGTRGIAPVAGSQRALIAEARCKDCGKLLAKNVSGAVDLWCDRCGKEVSIAS